ncbi:MAG TPA: metal-dependent hydrolase [Rariglobus sp.]
MTPVSHALLPVFLGQRWIPKKERVPAPGFVALVALSGALPDILSPHLSLDARYEASSHSLWALLGFILVVVMLAWRLPRIFTPTISILCVTAYAGHIACDAITGGVAFFFPFGGVQGGNYLPYWLWITSDGLLLIYLYLVYRWRPLRRKITEGRQAVGPAQYP